MLFLNFALLIGCGSDANLSATGPYSALNAPHIEDEILVGIEAGLGTKDRVALFSGLGMWELDYQPALRTSRVGLPSGMKPAEAARLLQDQSGVRFAELHYLAKALAVPNDPYYEHQWNLKMLRMESAWSHGSGEGTIVAVLDTGVREGGKDGFDDLLTGWSFIYDEENTNDRYGHGTHVAGTIAQATGNGKGAAGIAHGASILPVKVLGDDGWGSTWAISEGIKWSADQGADVINMSLGSWGSSQTQAQAINYARSKGVVVVAAAGNEDTNQLNWPAAHDGVIAVAAVDAVGKITDYSNYGEGLSMSAPGGDVYADQNGDGWSDGILQEVWTGRKWDVQSWQGTSMATPHVAAAAALVRAQGIEDPDEVQEILESTADDKWEEGWDRYYGAGVLDVGAAVAEAISRSGGVSPTPEDPEEPEEEEEEEEEKESEPDPGLVISNVQWSTDCDDFWISWETDEPATTTVNFDQWGDHTNYSMVKEHYMDFWACGEYRVRVKSVDAQGDSAEAGPFVILVE